MPRRPPHLGDFAYVGSERIFVTMCTFRRRQLFTAPPVVDSVCGEFLRTAEAMGVEGIAYCFMPDHLHALLAGAAPNADLRRFVAAFRQRSGYQHKQTYQQRLWQEGYFDRHLRDEEATFDVVSYIVNNPVRARLCATPCEYPYSGSSRYQLSEVVEAVQWRPTGSGSLG